MGQPHKVIANAQQVYYVRKDELPLCCPTNEMMLWNSHPRVYLPIEETGSEVCPYCGAKFILKEDQCSPDK